MIDRHTGARWFNRQPRWLRMLVYYLSGWQVIRMTIRHRNDVGLFAYTSEHTTYSWTRARRADKAGAV